MPSVHEAAMYEPLGWKVMCLIGFGWSRRKSTLVMSLVSTSLTSVSLKHVSSETLLPVIPYSLATAAHWPSGESARSRIGREHLVRSLSKEDVLREYMLTEPSSEPTMKKSSFALVSSLNSCLLKMALTVAATARLFSGHMSMFRGSPVDPVV